MYLNKLSSVVRFVYYVDGGIGTVVMSEVASAQSAAVPQTPQHAACGENEDKTATTTVRRPRNREVTSRYKSSTPQVSLNRRFTNSNGDRLSNAPDLPSPKWGQSADKRNPSPSRSLETKVSGDVLPNNDVPVPPKRTSTRTELLWPPSTKSLSTSMQCESYSQPLNILHKKSVNGGKDNSNVADLTLRPTLNMAQRRLPEPKSIPSQFQNSDQAENAQPPDNVFKSENSRWPGSNAKMYAALSKSVDLSVDRGRPLSKAATLLSQQAKPTYGTSRAPRPLSSSRALSQSINEGQAFANESHKGRIESRGTRDAPSVTINNKSSTRDSLEKPQVSEVQRETETAVNSSCLDTSSTADDASDMESVSSSMCTVGDSSFSSRGITSNTTEPKGVRGTNVPARFWQDAANRSVRSSQKSNVRSSMLESDLAAASTRKIGIRHITPMSPEPFLEPSLFFNEAPSPPWAALQNQSLSAFIPAQQPANLTRMSSYPRNTPSPGRSRLPLPSLLVQGHRSSSAAVMLTFGTDTSKRGKKGLTQIDESHLHRTLHNRLLQWRFVNARAEAAMDAQTAGAEKSLYNVCAKTFELRASTITKRIQLEQARQAHKLNALVSAQTPTLEAWSGLQQGHCLALQGTIQALESAIVRLPLTGGVKADALAVKEAMGSAFDVMNFVENSVNYLAPKAEDTYLLVSELAGVVAQERTLLEECADLVAMASALEMEESSLRAHMVQLESERVRVVGQVATNILVDSH